MNEEKQISGGVYCKICKEVISKPRKRKYFQKDIFINCSRCKPELKKPRTDDQCSENEIELIDASYLHLIDLIKTDLKGILSNDEIKYEIWNAVHDGTKSFLGEYYNDIIKEIVRSLRSNIDIDVNFNIKNGRDSE